MSTVILTIPVVHISTQGLPRLFSMNTSGPGPRVPSTGVPFHCSTT